MRAVVWGEGFFVVGGRWSCGGGMDLKGVRGVYLVLVG